jgi:hypothetical protein
MSFVRESSIMVFKSSLGPLRVLQSSKVEMDWFHHCCSVPTTRTPWCGLRTSASSFIPSTVSLWNNLDISIRNSPILSSFKNRVKVDIYKTPNYYNEGPRKLSILHTRLRHQCNSLNADLSKIHIINNFKCNCGASFEDAIHYFLECPSYLNDRRTLLSNCDDININIETLLFGNDKYSYDVNSKIFRKVRTFKNQSKRF